MAQGKHSGRAPRDPQNGADGAPQGRVPRPGGPPEADDVRDTADHQATEQSRADAARDPKRSTPVRGATAAGLGAGVFRFAKGLSKSAGTSAVKATSAKPASAKSTAAQSSAAQPVSADVPKSAAPKAAAPVVPAPVPAAEPESVAADPVVEPVIEPEADEVAKPAARTPRKAYDGTGGDGPRTISIPITFPVILAALALLCAFAFGFGWLAGKAFSPTSGSSSASGESAGSTGDAEAAEPGRFGPCPTSELSVYADNSISGTLGRTLATSGCKTIKIETKPSWAAATDYGRGVGADVWIPDSKMWKSRAIGVQGLKFLLPSIAKSPIVVASPQPYAARSWKQVFTDPGFRAGNPLSSTSALGPMLAVNKEVTPEAWSKIALNVAKSSVANASATGTQNRDDASRLDDVISSQSGVVAVSEQVALAAGDQAYSSLPPGGTVVLDYPVLTKLDQAGLQSKKDALDWFKAFVKSDALTEALASSGFRDPLGNALPDSQVDTFTAMPAPDPEKVQVLLRGWSTLTIPSKVLVVLDTSGSMNLPLPDGRTRMQVTREVLSKGIGYYPDSARLGIWTFSQGIADGGKRDWVERVPIRSLGTQMPKRTQRQILQDTFLDVQAIPDGGTGLYDTVMASYQYLFDNYSPDAYNWLIFFTDGANDDPGSISKEALLQRLREMQDPTKPIVTVFIGITTDADKEALNQIAVATGAKSAYIIEDPSELDGLLAASLGGLS